MYTMDWKHAYKINITQMLYLCYILGNLQVIVHCKLGRQFHEVFDKTLLFIKYTSFLAYLVHPMFLMLLEAFCYQACCYVQLSLACLYL